MCGVSQASRAGHPIYGCGGLSKQTKEKFKKEAAEQEKAPSSVPASGANWKLHESRNNYCHLPAEVVLIVTADVGELETGISKNGQTIKHALLA